MHTTLQASVRPASTSFSLVCSSILLKPAQTFRADILSYLDYDIYKTQKPFCMYGLLYDCIHMQFPLNSMRNFYYGANEDKGWQEWT
jgi:hypothetical protein